MVKRLAGRLVVMVLVSVASYYFGAGLRHLLGWDQQPESPQAMEVNQ